MGGGGGSVRGREWGKGGGSGGGEGGGGDSKEVRGGDLLRGARARQRKGRQGTDRED